MATSGAATPLSHTCPAEAGYYQASPSHVAERQVQKVKASGSCLLDRVLGSAEEARDSASNKLEAVGDAVSDVPDSARRRTQGDPIAAGLVAFGVGLLGAERARG